MLLSYPLYTPHSSITFGNTLNIPDNIQNASDTIQLLSKLTATTNTTSSDLTLVLATGYTSETGQQLQRITHNLVVVRPQLRAIGSVSER